MNKLLTKYGFLAVLLSLVFSFSSCGKNNDEVIVDDAWKLENEAFFLEKAQNPAYTKLKSEANDGYILYKSLVKGTGEPVYYTSRVEMYYKGTLINGKKFDSHQFADGAPVKFSVSPQGASQLYGSVISGWTVALQGMVEGDKWEVVIPSELGYGANANKDIPGYSNLIFEMEVMKVIQP